MDKANIAQGVAYKLFATENAVDAAILEASKLMGALIEARQDIGMSAVTGTETVSRLAAALTALTEARAAVVDTHNELAEVKLRVGIRTKLIGVVDKTQADTSVPMVGHRRAS
jgi:hypothetical protein